MSDETSKEATSEEVMEAKASIIKTTIECHVELVKKLLEVSFMTSDEKSDVLGMILETILPIFIMDGSINARIELAKKYIEIMR